MCVFEYVGYIDTEGELIPLPRVLNPWFQMIFGTFIVCVIWAIICMICRKHCGKKDPLLNNPV